MQSYALKAIFAVGTFVVCIFAGCLPLSLLQTNKIPWQSPNAVRIIRGLLAVSLGAFLGICFVGLFPSVQETQLELQTFFQVRLSYPWAEVSILASYFLFWLSAELSKLYFERRKPKEDEEHALQDGPPAPSYNSLSSCHDVGPHNGDNPVSLFDLILIVLSLSIKSVLESVTIGSLEDHVAIVQMGAAKLVHEAICTLVMALNLANAFRNSPIYYGHLAVLAFAVMNAAGFAIGIGLGSSTSGAALVSKFVLKALAGGAMMCVVMTLFVHLNKPLETDVRAGVKFTCVLFGFLVFAGVRSIHNLVRAGGSPSHESPSPKST